MPNDLFVGRKLLVALRLIAAGYEESDETCAREAIAEYETARDTGKKPLT